MNKIEVVIADDHPQTLAELQTWLDKHANYRIGASATDADGLLAALASGAADLIVMSSAIACGDATLRKQHFPVLRALRKGFPDTPVVVLVAHTDAPMLRSLKDAGAAGIVGRADSGRELERVCKRVMSGATGVLSTRIAELWEVARPYDARPAYLDVRISVRPFNAKG